MNYKSPIVRHLHTNLNSNTRLEPAVSCTHHRRRAEHTAQTAEDSEDVSA